VPPHLPHNLVPILFVVLLIGFPYILGPILIKNSQKIARRAVQKRYDPATLPPEAASFFYNAVTSLTQAGFTVIDYITKPGEAPNVTPCIVNLVNRSNGDMASVACFFAVVNGITQVQNNSVFLTTVYANGEIVGSCIMPPKSAGSCYKYRPYAHGCRFFDDIDVTELYRRHRFLVEKYAPNSPVIVPEPGREMEAFDRINDDVHDYQVKQGLMRIDTTRDAYVPTWFGAFYMTWALLWPCKQLRLAGAQAKAKRELDNYRRKTQ
jgi:hypothetical protein